MNQPVLDWARGRALMRASHEVRNVVEAARVNGFKAKPMGRAHVPSSPVGVDHWVVIPIEQDSSEIPERSRERVRALFEAGVRPKTFIVAHETTRMLAAPEGTAHLPAKPSIDWDAVRQDAAERANDLAAKLPDAETVKPVLIQGAKALGIVAAVAAATAAAVAAVPLLLVGLIGAVALADPVLIAVTEDDFWIEIDRWYV